MTKTNISMRNARLALLLIGVVLPYVARLPGGLDWLRQYTSAGIGGWLLLSAFNAIAWGSLLAISLAYRHPVSLLVPAVPGFGYIAWAHYSLDLAADAQAALGIIFIPIYALLPILFGGAVGFIVDKRLGDRSG